MKPAFVGCFVGLLVGKSAMPDIIRSNALNSLDAVCRECRVRKGEETFQDFKTHRSPAYERAATIFLGT